MDFARNSRKNKELTNEEIFSINDVVIKIVKRKIIKDKLIPYECNLCHINDWKDDRLVLQLDHINGNSQDNRLKNLRLLCPNCHSQTDTFCGRNRNGKIYKTCYCMDCDIKISYGRLRCKECSDIHKTAKVDWPDHDKLVKMVEESSYRKVGKIFNVSGETVRNRVKKLSRKQITNSGPSAT